MAKKKTKKPVKALKVLRSDIKKGKQEKKISKVLGEFKSGDLHSGSTKGPKVTSKRQAIAIALSEAKVKPKKKRKPAKKKRK